MGIRGFLWVWVRFPCRSFPADFPSIEVLEAFLSPSVYQPTERCVFAQPNVATIRSILLKCANLSQQQVVPLLHTQPQLLLPVAPAAAAAEETPESPFFSFLPHLNRELLLLLLQIEETLLPAVQRYTAPGAFLRQQQMTDFFPLTTTRAAESGTPALAAEAAEAETRMSTAAAATTAAANEEQLQLHLQEATPGEKEEMEDLGAAGEYTSKRILKAMGLLQQQQQRQQKAVADRQRSRSSRSSSNPEEPKKRNKRQRTKAQQQQQQQQQQQEQHQQGVEVVGAEGEEADEAAAVAQALMADLEDVDIDAAAHEAALQL